MINELIAGLAAASSVVAHVPANEPAHFQNPGQTLVFLSHANVTHAGRQSPFDLSSWMLAESELAEAEGWHFVLLEPQLTPWLETPSWAFAQVQHLSEVVEAALPVSPAPPPATPTRALPVKPTRTALDETICSLNVVDWDLGKVLQALSLQTQANLLLQAPADTKLTINLSNIPLVDMLRHICAVTGLDVLKVDNAYIVADSQKLASAYPAEWTELHPKSPETAVVPPVAATRVYMANFVRANQIADTLKGVFEGQGLTATAGPTQISPRIEERDTAAVTGVAAGSVSSSSSDAVSRVLILRGPSEVVEAALQVAKALDVGRAQVAIAVSIHDITNEAIKELGLKWSFGDVGITESTPGKGVNFGSFTRAPQSFTAMISALEKNDKAKLLASPNISVLDGEQAFILIGNRINYPVLIGYTQLNTPIFDKETEKVGIYLQVAATVSDANEITLSLYPQVSTITGFLQVNGASYPQIATREAQTTLRVANGETIVMGGLLRDEEITNMEKVPLLSEIPLLGELFKRRKTTKTSSQVIIAITPVVIPPKGQ